MKEKTIPVQVRLPKKILAKIDKFVDDGDYTSRQDFIKDKLRDIFTENNHIPKNIFKEIGGKLPSGWELYTSMCPIQYKKIIEIKGQKYEGYLRSRWGQPFSIRVYKLDKKEEWGEEPIWTHKPVDKEEDNPPLKSMKIVDKHFRDLQC